MFRSTEANGHSTFFFVHSTCPPPPSLAGDDACSHRCDDKEEDGDSCVECWANSEDNNTKGKNKKKKKKNKKCETEHVSRRRGELRNSALFLKGYCPSFPAWFPVTS